MNALLAPTSPFALFTAQWFEKKYELKKMMSGFCVGGQSCTLLGFGCALMVFFMYMCAIYVIPVVVWYQFWVNVCGDHRDEDFVSMRARALSFLLIIQTGYPPSSCVSIFLQRVRTKHPSHHRSRWRPSGCALLGMLRSRARPGPMPKMHLCPAR